MAAMKNIASILSPKFLSPLSPSRGVLNVTKSEGKVTLRHLERPNVVKKLDFSQKIEDLWPTSNLNVPKIKVEKSEDPVITLTNPSAFLLDINTPNKKYLAQNGLDKFKNRTTILGKGTFGTVFKGKHKDQTVAVKLIPRHSSKQEQNALNLYHENIVQTLEIIENSEYQNYCLVIMEYLPKTKSLQDLLANLKESNSIFDPKIFKKTTQDITKGLKFLHDHGVMHLDLKPKNILVDPVGHACKICDFGNSARVTDRMQEFTYKGTIIYTAPEILLGQPPTVKSDIYSLGLVFWQIIFLDTPFKEFENVESIIYNVGKFNLRPKIDKNQCDTAMETILTKCWDSLPESRPNAQEVVEMLLKA
ncbi:serine/threonine-protein kinase mos isoform X2 [Anthonomus grandis grandis]|uniref:serine/threonine-protein kinase mos isoform X2 n=1 Tax=Anthonomus grandis grandis TaxID=2921223 RepID=UPI002165B8B4|nr:serine/threonine-protein kinase mos isoform X2 [Anthonomus grandis grandis]